MSPVTTSSSGAIIQIINLNFYVMKKLRTFISVLTILLLSYSCMRIPAHANYTQLMTVYTGVHKPQYASVNPPDTNKKIKDISKPDSILTPRSSGAAPAPDAPSWLDKVFKMLKWVIPGIIILLRIIPTSKNVDIIALLNWIMDCLIPNLTKTNNGLETHTTTPVVAHRTFVGKLIGSILGT